MTIYPAKCAKCDLPLQGPANPQSHDMLSCPACGESDNLENVMREISDHARETAKNAISAVVDGTFWSKDLINGSMNQSRREVCRFMIDYDRHRSATTG